MVDINQWRASIGGWSCRCTSISWSVSNNKVKTNPTITDSVSILAGPATLSLVLVLVLLLVLSGDIELNPGPGSKPELYDVFRFLQPHSSKWEDIGRALKVDLNTRKTIRQQGGQTTSPEGKLEEVIDHWIQSCCSEVTWDNLMEVLQELKMVSTAKEIENCLLNNEKMKKKYNWKRVNEVQLIAPMDSSSSKGFSIDVHTGSTNSSSVTTTVVADKTDLLSTSDRSQVPECVQRFRQHYKGYYARTKTPAYHNKKPSPSITEFIDLILIDQKRKKESKIDKIAILQHKMKGDTKRINLKEKSTLSIDKLGNLGKSQVLVLIKGDPGVGKTTLAWELGKGWTEGRLLQTWDIVLLVQLRDKNIREANTLQSLIDPYNTHEGLCEHIQKKYGAGLMLIFDGFDELSNTQRQDSSFFMRLLRGEMLPKASIILTTRPSAKKLIPDIFIDNVDQLIEIHGFKEKAIDRYIERKFKDNSDILIAFQDYVSSHHFIFSLMYVPLHCALITDLYEHYYDSKREFAPKTLTELYTCLICCLIWRNTGREIKRISDLSDDLKHKFTELAGIAAMGIENKQYVFDDIASVDEFGLLQRVEIANEYYGSTSESCSFLHLTLQEYLAAYYWSTQKDISELLVSKHILPSKVNHLIKTKVRQNRVSFHWPSVHFYSGLTGIEQTLLKPIIEACRNELEQDNGSITYNYLCLLFESTSGNYNNTIISSAFATDSVSKYKINSSKEAYVTGYCIAKTNESVKWELEMEKSGLIKNLVHGIEHGKLENIKGSVIQEICVINGSSDCGLIQFFDYLEKISGFLKSLKLMWLSSDLRRFRQRSSPVATLYTFNLVDVSYEKKSGNETNVLEALLNSLEHFKSLQTVSLLGSISRCITDITIDEHGRVHLHYLDKNSSKTENCFPAFHIPLMSDVCKSLIPDYHFIPFVAVQQHPAAGDFSINGEASFRFGFRENGYSLLPFKLKSLFSSVYNLLHHDSITNQQLPSQLHLCDQPHFCPNSETVSFSTVTIPLYNWKEKRWITLKLMELHNMSTLRILVFVTPENIKLLMKILLCFYRDLTGTMIGHLKSIIEVCRTELKEKGSIAYNPLCFLLQTATISDNRDNERIASFATYYFTLEEKSENKVRSSIEAYVTGYCIARTNESVKWEIEMERSGLIKHLVHGIEHGKSENIKGSVIQKMWVSKESSDCDVLQFFNYLEKISGFLKNFKLFFNSERLPRRFQSIRPFFKVSGYERSFSHSSEANVHVLGYLNFYTALEYSISYKKNQANALGSFLNTLEHFKSLQTVSLSGSISRCITDTTIDEHGRVHLHYQDTTTSYTEHCFPAFCLHVPSDVCEFLPDYHFIPYVAVQYHPNRDPNKASIKFGFREYGYRLLPFRMMTFFNSAYKLLHHDSITDQQLPKQLFLCDQLHFCPTDTYTETVSFSTVTVHFYNYKKKQWTTLKLILENDIDTLRILVTPENIQLLMDILENTTVFKLVYGDSDYLQPLLQLIRNDLQRSLKTSQRSPQLAMVLDLSRPRPSRQQLDTKLPMGKMDETCNMNLIKCRIHCDLDHLYFVKQHVCSVCKVISFTLLAVADHDHDCIDHLKIFRTLTAFLFQQSTIKEFKLVTSRLQSSFLMQTESAKVILDGLFDNQGGLEVVVFDDVQLGLELICQGLRNHKTIKTLIINECPISLHMLIHVIRSGRNLKHLVLIPLSNCDFSIYDYRALLRESTNSSIEEVAIMENEKLTRKLLAASVQSLIINYKLILSLSAIAASSRVRLPLLIQNLKEKYSLGDTSQVILKSHDEFENYINSLKIIK